MPRIKKPTFFKIKFLSCALFLTTFFIQQAQAQFDIGNSDLTREIEKNLLMINNSKTCRVMTMVYL